MCACHHAIADNYSAWPEPSDLADKYLYLGCGGGENSTYTKGKLLIELIGTI